MRTTFFLSGLLLLLSFSLGTSRIRSDDAFLHLAVGRQIVTLGALPQQDNFLNSGEPGPWMIHSWLAEVIFYCAIEVGGIHLLLGLRALLVALTIALVFLLLRTRGSPPWLATLLTVAVLLAPGIRSILMRPLLFTHLLLVLFVLILAQVRDGRWPARSLWLLPLLMVPWSNLHAGHMAGAGLVAITLGVLLFEHFLGRLSPRGPRLRVLALPLLATLLATLVNPYGYQIWLYSLGFRGGGEYGGQVWEWVAATPSREPALFAFMAIALLACLANVRQLILWPLAIILTLMAMPLVASRFLFHGALGAALALGLGLPHFAGKTTRLLGRIPSAIAPMLTVAVLLAFLAHSIWMGDGFRFRVDDKFFPTSAVSFMKQHKLDGKLLNYREWGGYLLWNRPGHKVFADGRVAVSAGKPIQDYVAVAEAKPGFGNVLNRQNVQVILTPYEVLRPTLAAQIQPIAYDPTWALVYFDDVALIYQRVTPERSAWLSRQAYRTLAPANRRSPFRPKASATKAEGELRRACTSMPSARSFTYLGLLLMARKKYDEARLSLHQALKLHPNNPSILNNLGVLAIKKGRRENARHFFQQVLMQDPSHTNAQKNLRIILEQSRQGGDLGQHPH